MTEILLLVMVFVTAIAMAGLHRRMSTRVAALEKELEAVKADVLKRQALPAAATDVTLDAAEAVSQVQSADAPAPVDHIPVGDADAAAPDVEAAARAAFDTTASPVDDAKPAQVGGDIGGGRSSAGSGTVPPSAGKAKPRENLESYLGARWPVWVGGVALAFGGIFLVRYSIEAGLLGPAARLALATVFGLLLMGGGELLRRRLMPQMSERLDDSLKGAMIPGALTAAGAVTLIGATYAAYVLYDFIGATPAFLALALISFVTIALSLLHGQALAGLGLLASLLTPALVGSSEPNVNALFGFLALTWLAVNAASRARQWTVAPTLANVGVGLWAVAYTLMVDDTDAVPFDALPPTLALIAMVAGTGFFWPGRYFGIIGPSKPGLAMLLGRPPLQITLSLSMMILLWSFAMIAAHAMGGGIALFAFAAVVATLAALGACRAYAVWPAMMAGVGAVLGILLVALMWLDYYPPTPIVGQNSPVLTFQNEIAVFLALGAVFLLLGFAFLKNFRRQEPEFSVIWAYMAPAVPVKLAVISFLNFGALARDWTHGIYGLALGLVLLAGAEWLFRTGEKTEDGRFTRSVDWPANLIVAGSFAAFTLSLHALTNGIVTTILVAVLGFAYVLAMRIRTWPALPWMMAAAIVVVFARIAWQPTLVGPDSLGMTPFLNALTPGYGIPTLLAIATCWLLRNSADLRIRNLMQALASLSALITIAVLVRHAMNHGVLDSCIPTLGEQSIYTLVTIGFSGVLMLLDLKGPSPVFRYGSMIAGVVATINVLSLHVFTLNPFFSGEGTGPWPFVNLLLIGYLLPALAYGLVAHYARGRRPRPYVVMLALAGAALGFLWATLSVRRFWQGENIADWKGFIQGETYTYSVVWLLIGVALLVLGSRFDARSLRLASAGLVLVAVVKVFLIDMANLEGILRALSFIGLGAVLIGIGLFYQKILVKKGRQPTVTDS